MAKYTILGAGLSGLSCSYHLGHDNCEIFEKNSYPGGHVYSHLQDGFTWDEGPHVSFTENDYVKELFRQSVGGKFLNFPVEVSNYYQGHWIPHPAQSNLFALPEALREACLKDFIKMRESMDPRIQPKNYGEWLEAAFGELFSKTFPAPYTEKYWTLPPDKLTTDWIGQRVFYPDIESVIRGATEVARQDTHYIKKVRYPEKGGYVAYINKLLCGAKLNLGYKVQGINLKSKQISFSDGSIHKFEKLINTLPLPEFVAMCDAPKNIQLAAQKLSCTSLLLVNVTANHPTKKPFHWLYVYDVEKLSTRINCIELLSPYNAPKNKTGIQVEVYESKYRKFQMTHNQIGKKVCDELIEMGIVDSIETCHTKYIPYANVIFDHDREENQNLILNWLSNFGLVRESGDLDPMTD